MLTFVDIAYLIVFASSAYRAIYEVKRWRCALEFAFIALGASSSSLIAALIQGGFTTQDAAKAIFCVALAWGWIYMTRRLAFKFKANHDSYRAAYQIFLKDFGQLPSENLKAKHDIPAEIAAVLTECRDLIEPVRRRLDVVRRRVRVFRLFIGVSVGFLVAVFILPNLAKYAAISAVRNGTTEWRQLNGAGLTRIPIYWVGDRIIYITSDPKECLVHLQIAGAEQAVKKCPELIVEASVARTS